MAKRDRRKDIIAAAEKLFTSRRFHEVTTDDIAREARVGKGTLYKHFKDKDELFLGAASEGFEELCALLRDKVPSGLAFSEQLSSACAQISDFFEHKHRLFRMMQSEDANMIELRGRLGGSSREKRAELVKAVGVILTKGVEEGQIRSDVPPEVLAHFLLGMLRTRGRDLSELPEESRRHEVMLSLFMKGAGRHSDGSYEGNA